MYNQAKNYIWSFTAQYIQNVQTFYIEKYFEKWESINHLLVTSAAIAAIWYSINRPIHFVLKTQQKRPHKVEWQTSCIIHNTLINTALWYKCTQPQNSGCYKHADGNHDILPPIMSGRIRTHAAIRYGKVTVRAKIPKGDWIWPGNGEFFLHTFLVRSVMSSKSLFNVVCPFIYSLRCIYREIFTPQSLFGNSARWLFFIYISLIFGLVLQLYGCSHATMGIWWLAKVRWNWHYGIKRYIYVH